MAGFVHSPLLPASQQGATVQALVHITDWLPTILSALGVSTEQKAHLPLDGHNLWQCILGETDKCTRDEVLINFNTVCDTSGSGPGSYNTECPAPKAAIRVGDLKLLAECYDVSSSSFVGKMFLYNVSADPSESADLSADRLEQKQELSERLLYYGKQAALIPPLEGSAPWQGDGYYCARCTPGSPKLTHGKRSWETWCAGPPGQVC